MSSSAPFPFLSEMRQFWLVQPFRAVNLADLWSQKCARATSQVQTNCWCIGLLVNSWSSISPFAATWIPRPPGNHPATALIIPFNSHLHRLFLRAMESLSHLHPSSPSSSTTATACSTTTTAASCWSSYRRIRSCDCEHVAGMLLLSNNNFFGCIFAILTLIRIELEQIRVYLWSAWSIGEMQFGKSYFCELFYD